MKMRNLARKTEDLWFLFIYPLLRKYKFQILEVITLLIFMESQTRYYVHVLKD